MSPVPAREFLDSEVLRGVRHPAGSDLLELWYPALGDGKVLPRVRTPCRRQGSAASICFPWDLYPQALSREDPHVESRSSSYRRPL